MVSWHGLLAKSVPTLVTGVVGAAAYEALRKTAVKVPLREATVATTAWGLRGLRTAERKAQQSSEQARLTLADVIAEAKERIGEDVSLSQVAGGCHDHDR
ncbi:DUF1490 family protein [Mycobacterium kansasii]|uniref:DUF1490 domain-containing protein n=3 Tax=Mycobacterium kansasii TaxID=1768 RepID=A0A653EPM8_MYCKA|nr:DUF1490 family protein [Mycobacterium kansasii]AGZ52480.1 hypothetical protein MKAN_20855 [Mycobacterium kansasii ATCC 12478]ARG55847.1 hypothetical protein B1T43_08200 [Mycobacterium kansasii]ARG61288.1 hypothetical protein B1T45_08255 [Mycobacterium kansasii]ARG68997.1 hypothetical protein B1T47_08040 [Mycobacterium kansasii]ARG76373.1 hypothetical protein B1T51_20000 [Mycobacterium kansasii]